MIHQTLLAQSGRVIIQSRPFARRAVAAAVLAATLSLPLSAFSQSFVVKDIQVEGVQRTEAGTVFNYLPLRVGDRFDSEKGVAAIEALYATGLYSDVRLEQVGDVLIVVVQERPTIAQVTLSGLKEFDQEAVKASLRDVGLSQARVFDRSLLERAEQELKRQYLGRGKYAVVIKSTVTPVERNRVNVSIAVEENDSAKIRSIRFTGNEVFSSDRLRDQLQLTTSGWWTWYTKRDQYSRQKLLGDLEALKSFYLNRGYLDFSIESTQVSIAPNKQDIYLTINVSEGPRYTVSDLQLAGELLGLDEELQALVDVKPGDVFNMQQLNELSKKITDRMGELGYAFASANVVPEADTKAQTVRVNLFVDPGRRVYVRRVHVFGNTRTRDDVVRREIRQYEKAWYNAQKVNLSRDRIDRLGFFESVDVQTPTVPGTTDQLDVNFTVKERPTGSIQAGVGYSDTEKLVFNAGFSQQNVFGSGQALSLELNTSSSTKTLALTHYEPYVNLAGVSRSTEIYKRRSDLRRIDLGSVDFDSTGASVRFGIPFTEYDTVFMGLGYEGTDIGIGPDSPARYIDFVNQFGPSTQAIIATLGWARDSRDNLLVPTRGRYFRTNAEIGTPALDLQYYKLTAQFQQFIPLSTRWTLGLNTELGFGDDYNGKPFPLFKNFYAGGLGSVRGFDGGSLGPRDATNDPLGGNRKLTGSIELLAPLPGADRTLRGLAFIDVGQVWGPGQAMSWNDMRASAGLGIAWVSPVGPLKISYATPIRKDATDRIQRFQFQIGTGF
ncbi:MAG TPA: outer membrane protein assembly factor BamA [Burkholderiaceae bacterium]|mgnify:CR=1 FL=1|nr:outer membrane protein assembly factor BamA [Burkholderiaceae bacterium]